MLLGTRQKTALSFELKIEGRPEGRREAERERDRNRKSPTHTGDE